MLIEVEPTPMTARKTPEQQFRNRSLPREIIDLEEARCSAQIRLSTLCRVAGVSDRAYRMILRGTRDPKASTIHKLREAMTLIQSGATHQALDRSIIAEVTTVDQLRQALIARRKALGLSQEELNRKAGFAERYLSHLERGAIAGGRSFGTMSLEVWLSALDLKLKIATK